MLLYRIPLLTFAPSFFLIVSYLSFFPSFYSHSFASLFLSFFPLFFSFVCSFIPSRLAYLPIFFVSVVAYLLPIFHPYISLLFFLSICFLSFFLPHSLDSSPFLSSPLSPLPSLFSSLFSPLSPLPSPLPSFLSSLPP